MWYFTRSSVFAEQLERLRQPMKLGEIFGPDSIGSYFYMAYGLLGAFQRHPLPENLSHTEFSEAEDIWRQLTEFVDSGQVLRWFEMSTIINYSCNYVELLDNIVQSLRASESSNCYRHPGVAFENFRHQSHTFFLHWIYVLQQTTPWRPNFESSGNIEKPHSFDTTQTATEMMQIAKRWAKHSFGEDSPASGQSALFDASITFAKDENSRQQNPWTVCAHCSKVVGGHIRKHLDYACKVLNNDEKTARRKAYFRAI